MANYRIYTHAAGHPEVRGMGTTATAVGVLADHLFLTQVGDSWAYLIRQAQAVQLTKDQSLMQRLGEAREMTQRPPGHSARQHILPPAPRPSPRGQSHHH